MDTISMLEEGARLYDFTFIGGETLPATQTLLTFKAIIPDSVKAGVNWPVKINQVSMVMPDGTTVTTRTPNGTVGVYEHGDANTDNEVDIYESTWWPGASWAKR